MIEQSSSEDATIVSTEDGSETLISPIFQERYHSIYGARQESQVVFIDAGLKDRRSCSPINILELGFGTGLNALMSLYEAKQNQWNILYTGYEKFPVNVDIARQLKYGQLFDLQQEFLSLHEMSWNQVHTISPFFQFKKIQSDIVEMLDEDLYDVIYFDAFAPNAQEELWSVKLFSSMYKSLQHNGVLVTYCAKGQVKRNLKAAGFSIEPLPGPPGKREMTRARKI